MNFAKRSLPTRRYALSCSLGHHGSYPTGTRSIQTLPRSRCLWLPRYSALAYLSASTYIMFKLRHSQLDSLDVEELTTKEQKKFKEQVSNSPSISPVVCISGTRDLMPGWKDSIH